MRRGVPRGGAFLGLAAGCVENGIVGGVRAMEKVVGVPTKPDWCEPSRADCYRRGLPWGWSLGHVVQEP